MPSKVSKRSVAFNEGETAKTSFLPKEHKSFALFSQYGINLSETRYHIVTKYPEQNIQQTPRLLLLNFFNTLTGKATGMWYCERQSFFPLLGKPCQFLEILSWAGRRSRSCKLLRFHRHTHPYAIADIETAYHHAMACSHVAGASGKYVAVLHCHVACTCHVWLTRGLWPA